MKDIKMQCSKCSKEYSHAEANQANGSLVCWECRVLYEIDVADAPKVMLVKHKTILAETEFEKKRRNRIISSYENLESFEVPQGLQMQIREYENFGRNDPPSINDERDYIPKNQRTAKTNAVVAARIAAAILKRKISMKASIVKEYNNLDNPNF